MSSAGNGAARAADVAKAVLIFARCVVLGAETIEDGVSQVRNVTNGRVVIEDDRAIDFVRAIIGDGNEMAG